MLKGLAHVCIGSRDLAATEQFYCSALGMRKVFQFVRAGQVIGYYLRIAQAGYIEVFLDRDMDASRGKSPIRHLCLETDDIESVRRALLTHGYEVTEKKLGADRSWQVWTTDPAGVRIEFHQYTEQSSQATGTDCVLD